MDHHLNDRGDLIGSARNLGTRGFHSGLATHRFLYMSLHVWKWLAYTASGLSIGTKSRESFRR
jgi:hypothetical protein